VNSPHCPPCPPAHSQELPTTEKKSTRQPQQPITPSAPLTRCLRRISGVEITLSLVLSIKHRPSTCRKYDRGQWEESNVRPCGSPERGIPCSFTSLRTQFFCFLRCYLPGLQGPVATLTELPWSESQHNRMTSPGPTHSFRDTQFAFVHSVACKCARTSFEMRAGHPLNHLSQHQSHSYKPADIPEGHLGIKPMSHVSAIIACGDAPHHARSEVEPWTF
jgi:hypothetical protein